MQTHPIRQSANPTRAQRGATLVVALVMLVLLSLLGATVARIGLFDELGARGSRDQKSAFEAADAAIRDAEADIRTGTRNALFESAPLGFVNGCGAGAAENRGLCLPSTAAVRPVWQTAFANNNVPVPLGTYSGRTWSNVVNAAQRPSYVMEAMVHPQPGADASAPRMMFRVTAVGLSGSGNQSVALQSVVLR